MVSYPLVFIRGAGDLATGVAYRLRRCGFPVVMAELPVPLCVRRAVAFAEAVAAGRHTVEGLTAVRAGTLPEIAGALRRGEVPVAVDPEARLAAALRPAVLVDAVMAKRNIGTRRTDAPLVVALGPGFTAGQDCHAVVETQRGHFLGRVLYAGSARADTGSPAEVAGVGADRVLRAPVAGRFRGLMRIGDRVRPGDVLGEVCPAAGGAPGEGHPPPVPVVTRIGGVVRGLLRDGAAVPAGLKVGDVDPTGEIHRCHTISDKALAVAGGVLEAVLCWLGRQGGAGSR